jgi:putative uncharacterized protein (fragment)
LKSRINSGKIGLENFIFRKVIDIMVELVLCDDEKIYRNDLKKILGTELELSGINYRVTEFSCG